MNDQSTPDEITFGQKEFVRFGRESILPLAENAVTHPSIQWDGPPALLWLGFRGESSGATTATLFEIAIPEEFWSAVSDPVRAVLYYAQGLRDRDISAPELPQGFFHLGTGMLVEGYSISSDSPDPRHQELIRRREAGGSVPRYQDVPGSRENRSLLIHSAGIIFEAVVYRVGDTQGWTDLKTSVGRHVLDPKDLPLDTEMAVLSGPTVNAIACLDKELACLVVPSRPYRSAVPE